MTVDLICLSLLFSTLNVFYYSCIEYLIHYYIAVTSIIHLMKVMRMVTFKIYNLGSQTALYKSHSSPRPHPLDLTRRNRRRARAWQRLYLARPRNSWQPCELFCPHHESTTSAVCCNQDRLSVYSPAGILCSAGALGKCHGLHINSLGNI